MYNLLLFAILIHEPMMMPRSAGWDQTRIYICIGGSRFGLHICIYQRLELGDLLPVPFLGSFHRAVHLIHLSSQLAVLVFSCGRQGCIRIGCHLFARAVGDCKARKCKYMSASIYLSVQAVVCMHLSAQAGWHITVPGINISQCAGSMHLSAQAGWHITVPGSMISCLTE